MYDSIQFVKTTSSGRTSLSRSARRRRDIIFLLRAAPTLLLLLLVAAPASGGSATWNLNPISNNWLSATNWTPATVPSESADTATFGVSNTTDIVFGNFLYSPEINGIVFNAGASPFTITLISNESFPHILIISGAGITNNSGITQNFVTGLSGVSVDMAVIQFKNSATAGSLTTFTNNGGQTFSSDNTGMTDFFDTSSAATGTFTNNGSNALFGDGGLTDFFDSATAASATLVAKRGSNAGGTILFAGDSTGGTARVELLGNGSLDISSHNLPGVTVGSIEGSGVVHLGANNLAVGTNNLSTMFSGVLDGTGSLTKVGKGTLTLSGANSYTGGTTINGGKLVVNNRTDSGTGSGPVQVNAGRLGGRGTIAGAVTVGTGTGSKAFLSQGINAVNHRPLAIQSTLTFNSDATYRFGINSSTARADKVIANGVTINSGAQFSFADSHAAALPLGTVFTVIDNTVATPIAGTFSNLADGSTLVIGSNSCQADYEGGTGNDLTLTVIMP